MRNFDAAVYIQLARNALDACTSLITILEGTWIINQTSHKF